MELVSVIIPVFNSEYTIKDTVNSVINQTYTNIEIIVVNDGSTDNSENEILDFKDQRIVYIYQRNQGSPIAKNTGLSLAKGSYIQFLDADDLISLDKIENQIRLLDGRKDSICVCRTQVFNEILDIKKADLKEIDTSFLTFSKDPVEFLLNLNGVYGNDGMVQPNAYLTPFEIIKNAGYWSELLSRSPDDDSEFFCRVLINSREVIYDDISINYYRKSLNLLSSGKTIEHAFGALKTVELKSIVILNVMNTPEVKNALAKKFAKVAYNHASNFPEILIDVKRHLNHIIGIKKIPNVGGKFFIMLSSLIGFEVSLKLKLISNKFFKVRVKL